MDVDETRTCIDHPALAIDPFVFSNFHSVQPKNARSDKIIFRSRPFGGELAGRLARFKNHPRRSIGAKTFADSMQPKGRLLGIKDATHTRPSGADRVAGAGFALEMP